MWNTAFYFFSFFIDITLSGFTQEQVNTLSVQRPLTQRSDESLSVSLDVTGRHVRTCCGLDSSSGVARRSAAIGKPAWSQSPCQCSTAAAGSAAATNLSNAFKDKPEWELPKCSPRTKPNSRVFRWLGDSLWLWKYAKVEFTLAHCQRFLISGWPAFQTGATRCHDNDPAGRRCCLRVIIAFEEKGSGRSRCRSDKSVPPATAGLNAELQIYSRLSQRPWRWGRWGGRLRAPVGGPPLLGRWAKGRAALKWLAGATVAVFPWLVLTE